jgi:hypothetical protein
LAILYFIFLFILRAQLQKKKIHVNLGSISQETSEKKTQRCIPWGDGNINKREKRGLILKHSKACAGKSSHKRIPGDSGSP